MSGGEHEEALGALFSVVDARRAQHELGALLTEPETHRARREAVAKQLPRSLRAQYRADLLEDALSIWTLELYRRLPSKAERMPTAEWLRMVWPATMAEACRTCRIELGGVVRQCSPHVVISVELDDYGDVEGDATALHHARLLATLRPAEVQELLTPGINEPVADRVRRLRLRMALRDQLRQLSLLEAAL
jgi:hypothetical protein